MTSPRNAIVIGSGFGGLAAAIRLQARGIQTTILEKRAKIGGRAYQIKDKGYTFDMGPSLITALPILESVFEAAGQSMADYLQPVPLNPFYRVHFHDGTWIDYTGDAETMKNQMRQLNAEDADNYDAFMEATKPIYDAVITDGLGAQPFDKWSTTLSFVPQALKLGAWRSVAGYAQRFFKDPRHHFLFSFHPLFIGGNPFTTPALYLMIPYLEKMLGVWYTRGGMYSVVEALGQLFQELGGTILTETPASRIEILDGLARAVVANGRRFEADLVVSNGDIAHTYKHLVAPEHRRKWTDKKVDKLDYSMSCFLLYIGVKKKYPQLKHHTLILAERYKELIADIFQRKILPDDFSMYLHTPSVTDPTMAPAGCESMYVLVPVANNASGIDWQETAPVFREKLLDYLEEWGLEGLRENLEVLHTFTPDDFASQLNAHLGNAFAVEPKLTQSAILRPHNRSEDIDNLYLVGAGTHPGAGVPGVLLSAEATMQCIAEDYTLGTAPVERHVAPPPVVSLAQKEKATPDIESDAA